MNTLEKELSITEYLTLKENCDNLIAARTTQAQLTVELQKILNKCPQTIVAEKGVGSPGKEGTLYNNATKNAVTLFQEKFSEEIRAKQLTVIHGDILTTDINKILSTRYSVVANIPYYITGEIMRFFLEHTHKPTSMTLLVQKEVAERIIAKDKKESILSLSVKAFGTPSLISIVKRGSFFPIPNVDSAIIKIEVGNTKFELKNTENFFKIVKAGMAHKRKLLISNLKELYTKDTLSRAFAELSLSEKIRGEDIDVSTWIQLSEKLY